MQACTRCAPATVPHPDEPPPPPPPSGPPSGPPLVLQRRPPPYEADWAEFSPIDVGDSASEASGGGEGPGVRGEAPGVGAQALSGS
eukprot:12861744-Alexandrium_andersonii.AAC.1